MAAIFFASVDSKQRKMTPWQHVALGFELCKVMRADVLPLCIGEREREPNALRAPLVDGKVLETIVVLRLMRERRLREKKASGQVVGESGIFPLSLARGKHGHRLYHGAEMKI